MGQELEGRKRVSQPACLHAQTNTPSGPSGLALGTPLRASRVREPSGPSSPSPANFATSVGRTASQAW